MNKIFHLVITSQWEEYKQLPYYQAESLAKEGFIHCCMAPQVEKVANLYYSSHKELTVLHIDTSKTHSPILYEVGTDGQFFPHLYGQLNLNAVLEAETIRVDQTGVFHFPFEHTLVQLSQTKTFHCQGLQVMDYTAHLQVSTSSAIVHVPSGASYPMTYSTLSDTYYYLINGQIEFRLEEQPYVLKAGDFVAVPKGKVFAYHNLTSQVATFIVIHTPKFNSTFEMFLK